MVYNRLHSLLMVGGDIDDWKPPSEAEMKVINARRERQNKISKIMGEYLLKGYKMLNSICSLCGVSVTLSNSI